MFSAGQMHSNMSKTVQAASSMHQHTTESSNFNNINSATSCKQNISEFKIHSRIENLTSVDMRYKQINSDENSCTNKLLGNGDDTLCYSKNNTIPGTNSSPLSTTTINRRIVPSRSATFG